MVHDPSVVGTRRLKTTELEKPKRHQNFIIEKKLLESSVFAWKVRKTLARGSQQQRHPFLCAFFRG